jgi:hypothetical protein
VRDPDRDIIGLWLGSGDLGDDAVAPVQHAQGKHAPLGGIVSPAFVRPGVEEAPQQRHVDRAADG